MRPDSTATVITTESNGFLMRIYRILVVFMFDSPAGISCLSFFNLISLIMILRLSLKMCLIYDLLGRISNYSADLMVFSGTALISSGTFGSHFIYVEEICFPMQRKFH